MTTKLAQATLLLHLCVALEGVVLEPRNGEASRTTFTSRGGTLTFPAIVDNNNVPYFSDNLNFDAIDDQILIGAADRLYVLSKDLALQDNGVYTWLTNTTRGTCNQANSYLCRNHIRIYQRLTNDPDSDSLFVCGTQSGIEPQCRVLNISGSGLVQTGEPTASLLVSAHPDLPGFGEFRQKNATDNIYFSANFRTMDTGSYDISFQQVDFNDSLSKVETSRLYGWLQGNTHWLNSPVVFVDYQRLDYGQPGNELLEYYFVFLREKQSRNSMGTDVITRVLRLCRNDAGITLPTGRAFTSYLKARIFCEREMPPGTEFVGADDFQYNEMWSVAINRPSGGRYHETFDYLHLAYGAFSGPRIGPVGTAICVYRADMTVSSNGGIFDVFRNDVVNPITGQERENNYVMCHPEGRDVEESQRIQEVQNVGQIGENPLVVFEGFYVTQMVVDQVCVVRRSNEALCVNQDVLFLGTSDGRVLKAVFATDSGEVVPVIAEEIQLDNTDDIKEMKIAVKEGDDGSSKYLYVVTSSRIYRLPLERCSRHGSNGTSCIGSRDPYCVWDSSQYRCVASNLTAEGASPGAVPVFIRQNIHTGNVTLPNVGFEMESYKTMEGSSLMVTVVSNEQVPAGVVEVDIVNLTAKVGVQVYSASPIRLAFDQISGGVYRQTFSIGTRQDGDYRGNLQFQLSLRNTDSGAVFFTRRNATITITDIDGTLFRVGIGNLTSDCMMFEVSNPSALKDLVSAIAKGIGGEFPETNIINATLNCDNPNDKYVTLVGAMLVTPQLSTSNLLTALENWVGTSPKVNSLNVEVDVTCSVKIQSRVNSTCMAIEFEGISPSVATRSMIDLARGLSAAFVITLVIAITLAVVVMILAFFLWRERSNTRCPSSEVAPEKPGEPAYEEVDGTPDMAHKLTLADRRGSRELYIDIDVPEHSTDTLNPKSSEPLLGNKTNNNVFFAGLGEDHSTEQDCDVVHNSSAMERSLSPDPLEKSSNGIPLRGSTEGDKNSFEMETSKTSELSL